MVYNSGMASEKTFVVSVFSIASLVVVGTLSAFFLIRYVKPGSGEKHEWDSSYPDDSSSSSFSSSSSSQSSSKPQDASKVINNIKSFTNEALDFHMGKDFADVDKIHTLLCYQQSGTAILDYVVSHIDDDRLTHIIVDVGVNLDADKTMAMINNEGLSLSNAVMNDFWFVDDADNPGLYDDDTFKMLYPGSYHGVFYYATYIDYYYSGVIKSGDKYTAILNFRFNSETFSINVTETKEISVTSGNYHDVLSYIYSSTN